MSTMSIPALAILAILAIVLLVVMVILTITLTASTPHWFSELRNNEIRFEVQGGSRTRVLTNTPGWIWQEPKDGEDEGTMIKSSLKPNNGLTVFGRVFIPLFPARRIYSHGFQWTEWSSETDENGFKKLRQRGYGREGMEKTHFHEFRSLIPVKVTKVELKDGDQVDLLFQIESLSIKPTIPIFIRDPERWRSEYENMLSGIITNAARKLTGNQLIGLEMIVPISEVVDFSLDGANKSPATRAKELKDKLEKIWEPKRDGEDKEGNKLIDLKTGKKIPTTDEKAAEYFWQEILEVVQGKEILDTFGQIIISIQYIGYNNPKQADIQLLREAERKGEATVAAAKKRAEAAKHDAEATAADLNAKVRALGITGTIDVEKKRAIGQSNTITTYIEGGGNSPRPTIDITKK